MAQSEIFGDIWLGYKEGRGGGGHRLGNRCCYHIVVLGFLIILCSVHLAKSDVYIASTFQNLEKRGDMENKFSANVPELQEITVPRT